jgi:hypothetical protein
VTIVDSQLALKWWKMKKRICIDFDGFLNNYYGWIGAENFSTPQNGAEDFLCNLSKSYKIYIFITRNPLRVVEDENKER